MTVDISISRIWDIQKVITYLCPAVTILGDVVYFSQYITKETMAEHDV